MAFRKRYAIQDFLEPGMYTETIKVKVSRRWIEDSDKNDSLGSISMFLTDTSNYRIHCHIPSNLRELYAEILEEHKCYEIKNFMVSSYRSSCKCSDDEYFMIFMNGTIVLPLPKEEFLAVTEEFKFTKLSQIDVQHFQINHCIDVIGILDNRGTMDLFLNKHNEEELFLEFQITDIITKRTIRFRNRLAELFNNVSSTWNESDLEPTTISISSCKMLYHRYRETILLIDLPSTRFFINYPSQQDTILRRRYHALRNGRD